MYATCCTTGVAGLQKKAKHICAVRRVKENENVMHSLSRNEYNFVKITSFRDHAGMYVLLELGSFEGFSSCSRKPRARSLCQQNFESVSIFLLSKVRERNNPYCVLLVDELDVELLHDQGNQVPLSR